MNIIPGARAEGPRLLADQQEILRTLELLVEQGAVHELRALEVPERHGFDATHFGYYDHRNTLASAAARLSDRGAKGVYVTLNPVVPDLLARRSNRCDRAKKGDILTGDRDIARRRRLLLDFDPERPSGISATDAEKAAAFERAREVSAALVAEGWPTPVLGDSGNGAHLLYFVDLPADDGGLLERVLKGIAFRFGRRGVDIDSKVFNAARIAKIYGTVARKGDDIAERPHRLARLVEVPEKLVTVEWGG